MYLGVFIGGYATSAAGVAFVLICFKLGRSDWFFETTWSAQPKLLRRLSIVAKSPEQFRKGLKAGLVINAVGGGVFILIGLSSMLTAIK